MANSEQETLARQARDTQGNTHISKENTRCTQGIRVYSVHISFPCTMKYAEIRTTPAAVQGKRAHCTRESGTMREIREILRAHTRSRVDSAGEGMPDDAAAEALDMWDTQEIHYSSRDTRGATPAEQCGHYYTATHSTLSGDLPGDGITSTRVASIARG